ncbi:MAG: hypothetical protein HKN43_03020 [Rhodothermales bacterium]|nr:hypothetical protein [Rhodothermales bacterium]
MNVNHLNSFDYVVVALYMVMVLAVGLYVSRFNKKTTDYFKGGGHIPWVLSMVSLFVSGFSAFMFVGAAGFTYKNGGAAFILFSLAFPAYMIGYWVYGKRWRRTRIDTPLEFISRRFSPGTTYFYTVLAIVPNVVVLGTMIYTLVIFVSTALGFNSLSFVIAGQAVSGFQLTLIVTGIVMIIYTMLGGLWAVMVTDALQFVILFLISLIMLPVAFTILGDGSFVEGISTLAREAPEGYWNPGLTDRPQMFWLAYGIMIVLGYNVNWHIAQRYYSVPDERDTKKIAAWCAGLSLLLPMLWVVPVMASRLLFPDLASMWPELADPSEAAFVTLALSILPHGLTGIMVAAIFAATMSSVDTMFNWMAAVVTKDVFVPVTKIVTHEEPSERMQLVVGRSCVAIMGAISIYVALQMNQFGGSFDTYQKALSLYGPSMFTPVIFGLVFTRTPWWSGMAALGAGVGGVIVANIFANLSQGLTVSSFGDLFTDVNVIVAGIDLSRYEINVLVGVIVSTIVFFLSSLFDSRVGAFRTRIESLENDLRTPAHAVNPNIDLRGILAFRIAGWLSIGIGILLMIFFVLRPGAERAILNTLGGGLAVVLGFIVVRWVGKLIPAEEVLSED